MRSTVLPENAGGCGERRTSQPARFKQAGGDAPGKIMENAANIRNKELKLQKLVYERPSVPLTFSDVEDKVKF